MRDVRDVCFKQYNVCIVTFFTTQQHKKFNLSFFMLVPETLTGLLSDESKFPWSGNIVLTLVCLSYTRNLMINL